MVRPSNIVEVKPEVVDLEVDEEKSRVRSAEEVANDLEEAKRRRVEMAQQILIQSLLHWFSLVFEREHGPTTENVEKPLVFIGFREGGRAHLQKR